MNVLVTGSTGFVGSNLVKALSKKHKVFALVRRGKERKLIESLGAKAVIGDILNYESLQKACKNMDVVYHLAALVSEWGSYDSFKRVNYEGTLNLLKASDLSNVRQFVFLSSLNVLGMDGQIATETSPYVYSSACYVKTKIMAEKAIIDYSFNHNIHYTIFRACRLYGPGDRTYLPKFILFLKKGRMLMIDHGKHLNSFLYVTDLVDALSSACGDKRCSNQIIHLSSQEKTTNLQFIRLLARELGVEMPKISLPYWLALTLGYVLQVLYKLFRVSSPPIITAFRTKLIGRDHFYSTTKAVRLLNFKQKFSLKRGIRTTFSCYRKEGVI